eukprot:scaffold499_cov335-Pavlova_lutheri.AAC.25
MGTIDKQGLLLSHTLLWVFLLMAKVSIPIPSLHQKVDCSPLVSMRFDFAMSELPLGWIASIRVGSEGRRQVRFASRGSPFSYACGLHPSPKERSAWNPTRRALFSASTSGAAILLGMGMKSFPLVDAVHAYGQTNGWEPQPRSTILDRACAFNP